MTKHELDKNGGKMFMTFTQVQLLASNCKDEELFVVVYVYSWANIKVIKKTLYTQVFLFVSHVVSSTFQLHTACLPGMSNRIELGQTFQPSRILREKHAFDIFLKLTPLSHAVMHVVSQRNKCVHYVPVKYRKIFTCKDDSIYRTEIVNAS